MANEINKLLAKAIYLKLEHQAFLIIGSGNIDPNYIEDQASLLHHAIEARLYAVAKRLIDLGANVGVNCYDVSALHVASAIESGHEIIQHLLDAGANVNARSGKTNKTPLMLAAWNGHLGNAQSLIRAGADVNAVDSNGEPVLAYAANSKSEEMIYLLTRAGASVASSLFYLKGVTE